MNLKNIAKGTSESFKVDEGIVLLKHTNDRDHEENFNYSIGKDYIQFHFCLKGMANFFLMKGLIFLMLRMKTLFYYITQKKNCRLT